jgi:hypothetical protein
LNKKNNLMTNFDNKFGYKKLNKLLNYLDNNNLEDKVTRDKIKKVKNNVEKMIIESELNKMLKA